MKSLRIPLMFALALVVVASGSVWAQTVKVDAQQRQLLLAASSTLTMQQELDQAGALGFRVVMGTTRGNGELVLLLERDLRATPKYQFHLIATSLTSTFQREIDDDSRQGFRASPRTFLNKSGEVVVVMERAATPAAGSKRYEYKLQSTNQTSALESEWTKGLSEGYTLLATITRNEVMLLMEREAK